MTQEVSWRATYDAVQVVLRQLTEREFCVVVTDGALTHLHPVTDCDLESAKARARDHALRFASRLSHHENEIPERVVNFEWELVPGE